MAGLIGAMGSATHEWYYAGRDHIFFAAEADIYHDSLSARVAPRASSGGAQHAHGQRSCRTHARRPAAPQRR